MIAALRTPQPFERSPEQIRTDRLIAALTDIPPEFVLTPTSRKIPIRPGWQRENLSRDEVARLLQSGGWVKRSDGSSYRQQYDGIALIIPQPYVVVDIDGKTAHKLFCEITGQLQPDKTVAWGSGKPHNGSLLYRLPDALVARIAKLPGQFSKLRLTECPTWKTAGSDGIELLLPGSRATIPPSAHPETMGYAFKLGWDFGIQPAPDWVVQAIEAEVTEREYRAAHPFTPRDWSEIEVEDIRKALELLNPDCCHDDWIAIGMALHSTGNADYLDLWEEWSCQSHKYKAGECEQRWNSFRADGGIGLGRLFALAGIRITTARLPSQGFALLPGGQPETDSPSDRDRLIAKRMFTFRSNYKAATDRAFHLSDHPEVDTTWYQGWQAGDPLTPQLCAQTILIRGGLGSGKTEATLRLLAQVGSDRQIIWITSRRNLNRNTEARAQAIGLEVYNYQDDVATFRWMLRTGQPGLFMFCLEGLSDYHTQTIDWSKAIVVVDEFSGVRAEAPASKSGVFAEYERCLREAGTLLALDAHLSDLDLDILEMYRGELSRHLYRQVAQPLAWNVNWAECRIKNGEMALSHDGIGYSWVESELAAGFRLAIPVDCKLMAKTLALHCQQLGYPVALATSETVEFNGRFFPNPDALLQDQSIRALIYTPVAQNGLDIQTHFDKGLLLYSGIILPDQALQMMARCRQCLDWTISAPRRSLNPSLSFNALTEKKIAKTSAGLLDALTALNESTSVPGAAWGTAQRMIGEVCGAYASESLYCLLQDQFETIPTIELAGNSMLHRTYCQQIKQQEAAAVLGADRQRGQELLDRQRQPATDAEVWDIQAATLAEKYPKLWDAAQAAARSSEGRAEAIALISQIHSQRLGKLKNWVEAEHLAEQGLSALLARMGRKSPNPYSPGFKRYQNLQFYHVLQLGDLVKLQELTEMGKANETHFNRQSPQVLQLWDKFRSHPELPTLFPQVETIGEFWDTIRGCFKAMGFQGMSKNMRADSDVLCPNGKNRDGSQRMSFSRSTTYFGWLIMSCSGSALFQSIFSDLVEALTEQLWQEYQRIPPATAPPGKGQPD